MKSPADKQKPKQAAIVSNPQQAVETPTNLIFKDERLESAKQSKLQELEEEYAPSTQVAQFQEMADQSSNSEPFSAMQKLADAHSESHPHVRPTEKEDGESMLQELESLGAESKGELDPDIPAAKELSEAELETEVEPEPEEFLQLFIATDGSKEVQIGTQLHHVELRIVDGETAVGVASEWQDINRIVDVLLAAAGDDQNEIYGREDEINAIFTPVQLAKNRERTAERDYRRRQAAARRAQLLFFRFRRSDRYKYAEEADKRIMLSGARRALSRVKMSASDARRAWTVRLDQLTLRARVAIQESWTEFGDFLPANLIPAGAVFADRATTGNDALYDYHTGDIGDPIPIMWYKNPNEYPTIRFQNHNYVLGQAVMIGGVQFGVAAANIPNDNGNYNLRKVAHNETRAGQRAFNQIFNINNVIVGGVAAPALGDAGGFDGDHVKDLGFGGADVANNYWPLEAGVNRRAFNGYNSRYILNYLNADGHLVARAIGGLIGKYFVVKGFSAADFPAETNSAIAGTDQLA